MKTGPFAYSDILACRNELYGLSAIWVMLYHICKYAGCDFLPLGKVLICGNAGVDIFLFFSAIGLTQSIEKNSLSQFYKNRVKRLALPYFVCALVYFTWYDFIAEKDGIVRWLLNLTSLSWWMGDSTYPVWYVPFSAGLYALFPMLYKADRKTRHISSYAVIILSVALVGAEKVFNLSSLDAYLIALTRIPIFMIGIIASERLRSGKGLSPLLGYAAIFAGIMAFIYLSLFNVSVYIKYYVYAPMILAIIIAYSAFIKSKLLKQAFTRAGKYSYEIYLTHLFLFQIIKRINHWDAVSSCVWYAVIIALVCLAVAILTFVMNYIEKIQKHA